MISTKKQSVLFGSFLLMISVIVSKAAGLILKIPLANMLGGTGMGYYSSAYAVFMPLYAICAGSLPPVIAQTVAENCAHERYDRIESTKRVSLIFFSVLSIIISLIPLLFSDFISSRIIGNPEARLSVMAISPCIFFGTVTSIYRGYYEGLCDMIPTSVSQMVDSVVKLVTGLGFAYLTKWYADSLYYSGRAVFGVLCVNEYEASAAALPYVSAAAVLGTVAADLAGMVSLLIHSKNYKRSCGSACNCKEKSVLWNFVIGNRYGDHLHTNQSSDDKEILKGLIALITPIALASLVSSLLSTIDLSTIILLIKRSLRKNPALYSMKYANIISSGIKLSELPNFLYGSFTGLSMAIFTLAPSLCTVFGKSAFPAVSEFHAKSDKKSVSKEIRRAICACTYISIPAGIGLCVFSKQILGLLFPSRYAEISVSHLPLSVLSLGTVFLSVSVCAYSMLQAIGNPQLPVKITLVGAIIKLILNTAFIPICDSGLVGASWATVVSYFVMCAWSVATLYRLTDTSPKLILSAICPALCAVGGVGSSLVLYNYLSETLSDIASLGISVVYAVIFYIMVMLILDIFAKNKLLTQIFDQ